MDYNRIDTLDQGGTSNQGVIWQGGAVDAAISQAPFVGPILIVCMDKGEANEQWINHPTVDAVLAVWIDDDPSACLADSTLLNLAGMIQRWCAGGGNVYIHCAAGVSRASYMDVAVHCLALGLSADEALAVIKAQRPVANPNAGFMNQLQRLFPHHG